MSFPNVVNNSREKHHVFPPNTPYDPNLFKNMLDFRRSYCDCGFDPESTVKKNKKKLLKEKTCPVTLALQNHITFPSIKTVPDANCDPKREYFNEESGLPVQHWCMLIELSEKLNTTSWRGFSSFGEDITLEIDNDQDKPKSFDWSDFVEGNTVAVLYAKKQGETTNVKEKNLDLLYVFKSNLVDLFEEAKNLLNDADMKEKDGKTACLGCGLIGETLSRCANCKRANYCSKICQTKCWKMSHKKLCPQSEAILRLASLPRHSFKEYFSFKMNQSDESTHFSALPEYFYKPEFVYKRVGKQLDDVKIKNEKTDSEIKCGLCNLTNQESFLKKGKPLTKTRCCNNWICDDQHTYVMMSFARNSCNRNHEKFTLCLNHFEARHQGKWQDCRDCKRETSKLDYVDRSTNEYNFPGEKLVLKNRVCVKCCNCFYESDDLNTFSGSTDVANETKYYCKKDECKKKGGFTQSYDSFMYSIGSDKLLSKLGIKK